MQVLVCLGLMGFARVNPNYIRHFGCDNAHLHIRMNVEQKTEDKSSNWHHLGFVRANFDCIITCSSSLTGNFKAQLKINRESLFQVWICKCTSDSDNKIRYSKLGK